MCRMKEIESYRICDHCKESKPVYKMEVGGWWTFSNYPAKDGKIYSGLFCHQCSDKVHNAFIG